MRRFRSPIVLATFLLCASALAGTKSVPMTFSTPENDVAAVVTVTFTNNAANIVRPVPVLIPENSSATDKRDLIAAALTAKGYTIVKSGASGLIIQNLDENTTVDFDNGGTAETDVMGTNKPRAANIRFVDTFAPFDNQNQPAIFTAGIITDVGELSTYISASELNFQTDGPIICQALFQRLAPRAPQYGAQINYAGDRLEVYFDPAYTVTQGAIVFGTTSPTPGCGGAVILEQPDLGLSFDQLIAGQNTRFTATNAALGQRVYFYYTTHGLGSTEIPNLNVILSLNQPLLAGKVLPDATGTARLTRRVPPNAHNVHVDFQAAQVGEVSPVVSGTVQ